MNIKYICTTCDAVMMAVAEATHREIIQCPECKKVSQIRYKLEHLDPETLKATLRLENEYYREKEIEIRIEK